MKKYLLIAYFALIFLVLWIGFGRAYEIGTKVHLHTEIDMAIFHDASSAKVWADMYQGRIEVKENDTYVVWYPVTIAESSPNDWSNQ